MKKIEDIFEYHGLIPSTAQYNIIIEKLMTIDFLDYNLLFERCCSLEKITPKKIIDEAFIIMNNNFKSPKLLEKKDDWWYERAVEIVGEDPLRKLACMPSDERNKLLNKIERVG